MTHNSKKLELGKKDLEIKMVPSERIASISQSDSMVPIKDDKEPELSIIGLKNNKINLENGFMINPILVETNEVIDGVLIGIDIYDNLIVYMPYFDYDNVKIKYINNISII